MEEFNDILSRIKKYKEQDNENNFFIPQDLFFIYQKLQYFINNVHKVFKNYNSLINDEIENYKKIMQIIQQKNRQK